MKKTTMNALVAYLNDMIATNGGEQATDEIVVTARDELISELTKGKAKADANRAIYDEMRAAVLNVLQNTSVPVTAQELADETGYAKGKIVYGLTNYWADEVEKIPGKTNTYTIKA